MEKCTDPAWASEQLTAQEAFEFANSGLWKTWTDEQIVRFQLFQKKCAVDLSRFHDALNAVLNRRVFLHELICRESIVEEYLTGKEKPTMEEIINLIPADKRIILGL